MNVLVRPAALPRTRRGLSSLTAKYVMALTGVGLILFVLAHMAGNLLIYGGKDALNAYAEGLASHPGLLWFARSVLLIVFVLHIVLGVRLWLQNRSARPVPYHYKHNVRAGWASRNMLLTGLVILAFVVYHLLHFTLGVTDPADFKDRIARDPRGYYDVAGMVVGGFAQPAVSIGYIVAQIILGLHLWHGARSWFQSLGLNRKGYDRFVRWFGVTVATVVVVGNCSIPLAILAGWRPAPPAPAALGRGAKAPPASPLAERRV